VRQRKDGGCGGWRLGGGEMVEGGKGGSAGAHRGSGACYVVSEGA